MEERAGNDAISLLLPSGVDILKEPLGELCTAPGFALLGRCGLEWIAICGAFARSYAIFGHFGLRGIMLNCDKELSL